MKGSILFEVVDGGISVDVHIRDARIIDKAMLINSMFVALDIDMRNNEEVAMICALATTLNSTKIEIDKDRIQDILKAKEEEPEA